MSRTSCSFDKAILNSMDCLDLSQDRLLNIVSKNCLDMHSDTEQNLAIKHEDSMKPHNLLPIDPLDAKLENQMKSLFVPKYIQSQVLNGLATDKKQILLSKYSNSSSLSPRIRDKIHKKIKRQNDNNHQPKLVNSNSHISSIFDADIDSVFDSYHLDIELLDLLKQSNMALTSLQKLKTVPNWKKTQYISTLKRKLNIRQISETLENAEMDSVIVNRGSPMLFYQNNEDSKVQTCLRCLRDINANEQDNKCRFHAFPSQKSNSFMDINYFIQRNDELDGIANFCFSCCHRKCNGHFGPESQRNGCHIVNGHLFECHVDEKTETKDDDHDDDDEKMTEETHPIDIDLCGKWKVMQWIENRRSLLKICDVEIMKQTHTGHVEGYLIGTLYIDGNKYEDCVGDMSNQMYSGHLSGDQLILTYHKQSYRESYVLFAEDYQLNGNWIASSKERGTCQWIKVAPLSKCVSVGIPIER